jgi:TetR/AcrR family transcriptional regulator
MRPHDRPEPGRSRESREAPRSEPPPAKRSAVESQKRILDAAEEEFAKSGFAGARLREIAAAAQVQPALIHHYFTDKRGLYEAVIRRALDQMSIASLRVLGEGRDLRGYLRGFVDLLVDFYEANHNLLAIMRAEALSGSDISLAVVREKTQPILEAVLTMTRSLMKEGEIRSDLPAREILIGGLSLILYPIVDAPILGAIIPDDGEAAASVEARKASITELLLGAIRPRAEGPRPRASRPRKAPPAAASTAQAKRHARKR